ncbi:hypothetical protein F2Q69_00010234 [Brassica cretica]|uniref:UspA domain-containing protein n=1 Tax=Brassica cretica TaxID=69181 RepID=A0A8S9QTS4_BRACR|nr:hypothetical protein F2Q69_00010234 [Brassica cretica]
MALSSKFLKGMQEVSCAMLWINTMLLYILVVGSHGYGAIKRAVLGSVSDYCAHHAHCSVMIVKKPKIKV